MRFCDARWLGVWALAGLPAGLAADPLAELVKNSPFGAPPAASAPAAENQPLEFRGVFADGGEYFFSIYDPAERRSHWVGLAEPGLPFRIRAYDPGTQAVVAEYQGRQLTLALKKAPVAAAPATLAAAPAPPSVQPVLAATASPPEEAARLAAIAAEIRRRRELRQKPQAMEPPADQP